MSTIIMISIVVIVSCAFGIFALFNAEDKPKHKTPSKHALTLDNSGIL